MRFLVKFKEHNMSLKAYLSLKKKQKSGLRRGFYKRNEWGQSVNIKTLIVSIVIAATHKHYVC